MQIAGKTVVVAGGAGSIGAAVVAALAADGAVVAVLDAHVNPDEARANGARIARQTDAADDAAVAAALGEIVAVCGPICALVNCAGYIHSELLVNLVRPAPRRHATDAWDMVIRDNLTAAFVLSANVAEHLALTRTKGVIVHVSSIAASGNAGQTAYSAAKAGIEAMIRVWAVELGRLGIRVVGVAPGFVDTPSTRAVLSETALAEIVRETPLRRLATTAEIASAIVFALANDFLTGRIIAVDGGLVL